MASIASTSTYPVANFEDSQRPFLPDSSSFTGSSELQKRNGKRKSLAAESGDDEEDEEDDIIRKRGCSRKSPKVTHVHHYENGVEMMKALAKSFKCPEDSAFFGSFDILNVPEIPDRDRVQLVTYEIWRATGYRFTCVDQRSPSNEDWTYDAFLVLPRRPS
ncbi:hypothetical protein LENED_003935 [Lentinula edodes]|uniref:Uncharacterized protein n=1 Tax=Lentinula edodes TaxID=5353 RepID=A0A1Q3E4X4_LENED|nr:hypothetical protein LENED_003935 [Lentinula edodes]